MSKKKTPYGRRRARAGRLLRGVLAAVLAAGLVPAASLAGAVPAYAAEGGGARSAPLPDYIEANIDEGLAPVSRDEGPLAALRGLVLGPEAALAPTSHALIVKNTMLDASELAPGDGYAEIWSSEERVASTLVGQFEGAAVLYDPGEESEYLVAFADTAGMGGAGEVVDWLAAEYDISGTVIDGIAYDAGSGIAYVPKSLYDEGDRLVQLQLLVAHDFGQEPPTVDVRIDNLNPGVTAVAREQAVEVDPLDVTVDVPVATPETASAIEVWDLEVRVNGSEAPMSADSGQMLAYDRATGVLTVAGNASTIASVDVTVKAPTALSAARAEAATPDSMRCLRDRYGNEAVLTNIDPDAISVGQAFTYYGVVKYTSREPAEQMHEVLETVWPALYVTSPENVGAIQHAVAGNGSVPWSKLISPRDEGYPMLVGGLVGDQPLDLVNAFDWPVGQREPGTLDKWGWYPEYTHSNVVGGIDWTGFPKTSSDSNDAWMGIAQCAHVGISGDASHVAGSKGEGVFEGHITMRVLAKADDYLVVGFVLPTVNTQTGAAVYKIRYESKGQVKVQKKSANPGLTDGNKCYTFEGIRYGVYSDAACTKLAATLALAADGACTSEEVKSGTYWVKEISTNSSYALSGEVKKVEVPSGGVAAVEFADEPLNDPEALVVRKYDAGTGEFRPSGDAKLALAEYTFEYVDAYAYNSAQFDAAKAASSAKRTWVMRTDADGYVNLFDGDKSFAFEGKTWSYKAGGDSFYRNGNMISIPLGTIRVRETKAPQGYNLSDSVYIVRIVPDPANPGFAKLEGDTGLIQDGNTPTLATKAAEEPVRGGVTIRKRDLDTKGPLPLAKDGWEGVAFEVVNKSSAAITYKGAEVAPNGVVDVITPDVNGRATTGERALPYGRYSIREVAVSDAYKLTDGEPREFSIAEEGQMVLLDGEGKAVYNQVKRGDIDFTKAGEYYGKRLAGVPFVLTALDTGESHIVVTDANGYVNTSSSWNPHAQRTNASDAAVDRDGDGKFSAAEMGKVDEALLDADAGIWFGTDTEGRGSSPDDAKGALPYGRYTLTELRCSGNAKYELIESGFTVTRDGFTVPLGTIEDPLPEIPRVPRIATSARDAADGDRILAADPEAAVIDRVEYSGLEKGTRYRLEAVAMDSATGEPVRGVDGSAFTAEKAFSAADETGWVEVGIAVDATLVEGDIVVYERLYAEGSALPVATHEDIDDFNQTVRVVRPRIGTELLDAADGDKQALAAGTVALADTIAFSNLAVGVEYEAEGTLSVLRADGTREQLTDAAGDPVTGRTTFVPSEPDGTVEVSFEFPAELVAPGEAVTALERLYRLGTLVASHEDPDDQNQTVDMAGPSIGTTATDGLDGDKLVSAEPMQTIVDRVSYTNLEPGAEHVLVLALMDVAGDGTFKPLIDAAGNACVVEHPFTPDGPDGFEDVAIEIDAAGLGGRRVVAFERLLRNGVEVASHEDPGDEGQTVEIVAPSIGTTATDAADGDKTLEAAASVTVRDTVRYKGLVPEVEHVLELTLVSVAEDGSCAPLMGAGGEPVARELAFTPDEPDGSVDVTVELDASELAGGRIVAFEAMTVFGEPVASHEDPDDEGQTVRVAAPALSTEAVDATDGDHTLLPSRTAVIADTVSYEGLERGEEYLLTGALMDKSTGKPVIVNDAPVTGTLRFTPNAASGVAEVPFEFDASGLTGTDLVVFETLAKDGRDVAEHADIDDEAQTVTVTSRLPFTGRDFTTYAKTGVQLAPVAGAAILIAAAGIGALRASRRREEDELGEAEVSEG